MDTKDITGLMEAYVAVYDEDLRDEIDTHLVQEDLSFIDDLSDNDLTRIMESIIVEGQFTFDDCEDLMESLEIYSDTVLVEKADSLSTFRREVKSRERHRQQIAELNKKRKATERVNRIKSALKTAVEYPGKKVGQAADYIGGKAQRAKALGGGAASAVAGGARDLGIGIRGRLSAAKEKIKGFLSRAGEAVRGKVKDIKQQSHIPFAKYASARGLMRGPGLKTQSSKGRAELRGAVARDIGTRAQQKVQAQKTAVKKGTKGLIGRAAGYVARKAGELAQRMQTEELNVIVPLILEDLIQEGYAQDFEDAFEILEDLTVNEFENLVESYLDSEVEIEDHYDTVMDFLLDEGFAETEEDAEVIMANMSDDWRDEILEGFKPTGYHDDDDYYSYSRDEYPSRTTSRTGRRIQDRVRKLSKSSNPEDQEKAKFIHKKASDRTSHERGLAKAKRNRQRGPGPRRAKQDAMRDMEQSGF